MVFKNDYPVRKFSNGIYLFFVFIIIFQKRKGLLFIYKIF